MTTRRFRWSRRLPVPSLPALRIAPMVLLILLFVETGRSQEASVRFGRANEQYRSGAYREAAGSYEEIVANGYESPALYFNLGNAYYKLGNVPAAVLNYERALRLDPNDGDALYNLQLANLRVVDRVEPVPRLFFVVWWERLLNAASSGGWSVIGLVSLWGAAVLLAVLRTFRLGKARGLATSAAVIALVLTLFSFSAAGMRAGREQPGSSAIVFGESVAVKSAPDGQSTDLFVVHEGIRVDVMDAVGDWWKIRLADGKEGWIPGDAVRVI